MERRNETARQASLKAGLNHGAISHYLKGNRPSMESAKRLAEYYGVPEEFILQLVGLMKPTPGQNMVVRELGLIMADWTDAERQELLELARFRNVQRRRNR